MRMERKIERKKERKKEMKKERKKERRRKRKRQEKGKGRERKGEKKQCLTRTIFDAKSYRFRYHFISVRESAGTFHKMIRPFTAVHLCYDAISVS